MILAAAGRDWSLSPLVISPPSCCGEEKGKKSSPMLWPEGNIPSSLPALFLSLTHRLWLTRDPRTQRSEFFPTTDAGWALGTVLPWKTGAAEWPTSSAALEHCSLGLCWANSIIWRKQWKKAGLLMKNGVNNVVEVRETKREMQMSYRLLMCWFSFRSIWAFCKGKLEKQYIRGRICWDGNKKNPKCQN